MNDDELKTKSQLLRDMGAERSESRRQRGWNEFVQQYGRFLVDFVQSRGLTEEEARDAVQETLVALVEALPSFDKSKGRFRAWLLSIARHKVVDILRKRSKAESLDMTEADIPVPPNTEETLGEMMVQLLDTAFQRLQRQHSKVSGEKWPIIRELCVSGRKPADVAAGYELPVKNAYRLKEDWQPELIEIARGVAREWGEFVK